MKYTTTVMDNALEAARNIHCVITLLGPDHPHQSTLTEALHNVLIIADQARQDYQTISNAARKSMTSPGTPERTPRGQYGSEGIDAVVVTMAHNESGRLRADLARMRDLMDAAVEPRGFDDHQQARYNLWFFLKDAWPFWHMKLSQLVKPEAT